MQLSQFNTVSLNGYLATIFLAYSERLKCTDLLSLELRRLHFDLIWYYKERKRKKIEITGQKYNGLPYYIGRP